MISTVILGCNPKTIKSLTQGLNLYSNHLSIVNTFSDPNKAIAYLNSNPPDCLFLDVQIPNMSGLQLLNKLNNVDFALVITANDDAFALEALKNEAVDYLLKPFNDKDLSHTIKKVKKFKNKSINAALVDDVFQNFSRLYNKKKVTFNTDGKLIFVDVDDIIIVQSDGNYSTIVLENGQKLVVTKKLKEVNSLLPEHHFFRTHNSFIVNLYKIKTFIKNEGYVIMSSNYKVPVARQRKSDFLERL